MALRIVGCGNIDRGDDGAGLLAVRRLRALGAESRGMKLFEHSGDGLNLIDIFSDSDDLIVVDATAPSGQPGCIRVWNAKDAVLPKQALLCSTHAFDIRETIELARALDRLPSRLIIFGIEAARFDFVAALTPEVETAVGKLARLLLEMSSAACDSLAACPPQ